MSIQITPIFRNCTFIESFSYKMTCISKWLDGNRLYTPDIGILMVSMPTHLS